MAEYVELARAESERGELVLRRRADDDGRSVLELRANGLFVMDTRETSTEVALARAALERVAAPRQVLVGGLGLGFTARAVLADGRVEGCTVVEIEPALAAWLSDGLVPGGPETLADPRVTLIVADVAAVLSWTAPATYDLVLLDVDNGPGHLVHDSNAALYDEPLLAQVYRVLRPGGALAVWSADRSPDLEARLAATFDGAAAAALPVDLQGRSEHYWMLAGTRDADAGTH
ncbi:MAG: hypothetical protein R2731_19345 [Nocardioides sp.]